MRKSGIIIFTNIKEQKVFKSVVLPSVLMAIFFLPGNVLNAQLPELTRNAYGYFYAGQYAKAESFFSAVIQEDGGANEKLYYFRGKARYCLGFYSKAEADFKLASEYLNMDLDLWTARIYSLQQRDSEALLYLERYLHKETQADILSLKKDTAFKSLHQHPGWFDLWQKDWSSKEQEAVDDARYYLKRKDYQTAMETIDRVLPNAEHSDGLYYFKSKIYAAEDQYELGLIEVRKALQIKPDDVTYLQTQADLYLKAKKYQKAEVVYTQIIDSYPENLSAYFFRAESNFHLGNYDLASDDLSVFLTYLPNDFRAQFLAGKNASRSGKYKESLTYFNVLLREEKGLPKLYKERGMVYYKLGTYEFAAKDLSMSLDLDPTDGETFLNYGLAKYYLGDLNYACYAWQKAKQYGELKALEYLQKHCSE